MLQVNGLRSLFGSLFASVGLTVDFQTFGVQFSESGDKTTPESTIKYIGQQKLANEVFSGHYLYLSGVIFMR